MMSPGFSVLMSSSRVGRVSLPVRRRLRHEQRFGGSIAAAVGCGGRHGGGRRHGRGRPVVTTGRQAARSRLSSSAMAACAMRAIVWSARRDGLQLDAQLIGVPLIDELRQRLNRFDPDLALGARANGSSVSIELRVAELAERTHHDGHGFGIARLQHLGEARNGFLAADLGERIDRALAHPPVVVVGRLDERLDGALVLRLVENLDGRAADVLVLVADELQHGVDDARAADLAERVGRAAAHPPVAVFERLEQVFDRAARCRPR